MGPVCERCPHLAGVAEDIIAQESEAIGALMEAATYRHALITAIELLHVSEVGRLRAEKRLRQVAGIDPWHPEETETYEP